MHVDPRRLSTLISTYQRQVERWRYHRWEHPRSRRPRPTMADDLAAMLVAIADGITRRRNFSGYSYVDDLRSEALVCMVHAMEKFDTMGDTSPHAYLSRCAWNAVLKTIAREAKQDSIRASISGLGISSHASPCQGPWPHDDVDRDLLPESPAPHGQVYHLVGPRPG